MRAIGYSVSYAAICRDYNTAYLDRDNTDPDTKRCMKQVVSRVESLIDALTEALGYRIYRLNDGSEVPTKELASNRFLFYSLEKAITIQYFLLQPAPHQYQNAQSWQNLAKEGILVKNDDEGEALHLYAPKSTKEAEVLARILSSLDPDTAPPLS